MKIAHIVGNRPQFIKLSLLYRALQHKCADRALIIHTGQHFSDNMSAIFFEAFGIPPPDHQLHINGLPHGEMIGRMLIGLDAVLAVEKPDAVIVYGDTNTTLAGALAAKKRHIPVVHIESGIRTGKEDMPEESNRYLTDRLADLNFACTYLGMENLLKEGYTNGDAGGGVGGVIAGAGANAGGGAIRSLVFNTGDLMLDAAMLFKDRALQTSTLLRELSLEGDRAGGDLGHSEGRGAGNRFESGFVLATIHRAENIDDPAVLAGILEALHVVHADIPVIFPVHPRTRQVIDGLGIPLTLHTTPPLGYFDMLALVQTCQYVVTDSGGLSREAFFFQKPSLIVMQHPFWPEIFAHGPSLSSGAEPAAMLAQWSALRKSMETAAIRHTGSLFQKEIFGDGHAAEKITDLLLTALHC